MPKREQPKPSPSQRIRRAAEAVNLAHATLRKVLAEECEGPHNPVPHRDMVGKPWCTACRHTSDGRYVPLSDLAVQKLLEPYNSHSDKE